LDFLNAFLLAVVEGLTEFLPVSSTGHLIIVEEYLKLTDDGRFNDAFMVMIQFPAILAVMVYFFRDLWPFGKGKESFRDTVSLWSKIVVAFLPAAVLGLLLHDAIKALLFHKIPVAIALVIGGILIVLIERIPRVVTVESRQELGYGKAFAIGCLQCLALIPGTSRSAATIIGAMALGTSRAVAAEFSFFLAIPTMLGAFTVEMASAGVAFTARQWALVALGSVVSFTVAYAVVALLMRYIKRHDFQVFGYYRIALGGLLLAWYLLSG
jgi:undecaprenyl-diphosphatase